MTFHDLEKICIGLYGTAWQAQLTSALNKDRRNVQNWRNQGVPDWVFHALEQIINQRKAELIASEEHYQNLKKEIEMSNLVHTEFATDFVKVNFYCKELALPSRSVVLAVEIECGAKKYTQEIRFKGNYNYFNQVPSTADGATDIDCIRNDFKKLIAGKKLTTGTAEIIYEYLMLIRLAVYDALDVANNDAFKSVFEASNILSIKDSLKIHYDKITTELTKLS